jgi:hypothetical protein
VDGIHRQSLLRIRGTFRVCDFILTTHISREGTHCASLCGRCGLCGNVGGADEHSSVVQQMCLQKLESRF